MLTALRYVRDALDSHLITLKQEIKQTFNFKIGTFNISFSVFGFFTCNYLNYFLMQSEN